MRALPESHKLQVADAFCKTLVRILMKDEKGEEQLTDEEKNRIFQDIEELKIFTNGQKWQELITYLKSVEHLPKEKDRVEKGIIAFINGALRSDVTKDWVMLHLKEDFLNVLEVSLRRFNNYILPITIEVPNFVDLDATSPNLKIELPRKEYLTKSILENMPSKLKSSNKVVVVKYDIINYPDEFPEKGIERQGRNFDSLILNPFPNYVA